MFDKHAIVNYIEDRHLKDGGYFFARVEPSSGLDTYLAVKTLKLLGQKPKYTDSIIKFWQNEERDGNVDDLTGIYFASQTYKELGYPLDHFQKYKDLLLTICQSNSLYAKKTISLKGEKFGLSDSGIVSVYVDMVEGEAKSVYYLLKLLDDLKIDFDSKPFVAYIHSLLNDDGGFGSIKGSESATTYYCLEIQKICRQQFIKQRLVTEYLIEQLHLANYLEEYHWSILGLHLLGKHVPERERVLDFISACYRGNGGFSRSQFIGISSVEYTYQAISTLKVLRAI